MLIGAMNHPAHDILSEIRWMAELKLDFIDLTLEPPGALSWNVQPAAIKECLAQHNLKVVGHTAYYLPFCSPFESIRAAAVHELKHCLRTFAQIGVKWINIHPDRHAPQHGRKFIIEQNIKSILDVMPLCQELGVGLMIENLPGDFNTPSQLGELLDAVPELGLHLDIGHANLMTEQNTTAAILKKYGNRLRHAHLHDNKGGSADLHLPLGTGNVDLAACIKELKRCGYDGTITLEVFSPDRHFLAYSRDRLRELWGK